MQSSSLRAGRARGLAVEYSPWWDIIVILVNVVIIILPTMVGHHRHHRHRRQRRHHHRARGLPVEHHGETPSPSNPPRPAANCASILKYLSFWFRLHCKNYELRTSCEKLFTNEIFVYRSAAIKYKDTLNNVWGGESIYFMYQCPL